MSKEKLNIIEQINHMKENGIKFNIISEEEATEILSTTTYYFKLKAYCKNYSLYHSGENVGKYFELEFAYLRELSILDALLRKEIIKISLDIEHYLKVRLLNDFALNEKENGYTIVKDFLNYNPELLDNIIFKGSHSTCADLVNKYKDDFAIWNIVEVLSFGDFIEFYKLYYARYSGELNIENMLLPVKFLRNAAAHNNCLINNLGGTFASIEPNKKVLGIVSSIPNIPQKTREKKMKNPIVHDFVVMLYVFNTVVTSQQTKRYVMESLKILFSDRFLKHKEYFSQNALLVSHYEFAKKIIDFFANLEYNNSVEQK